MQIHNTSGEASWRDPGVWRGLVIVLTTVAGVALVVIWSVTVVSAVLFGTPVGMTLFWTTIGVAVLIVAFVCVLLLPIG